MGWTGTRAGRIVYGGSGGHTEEPSDSHLLSAFVSGGESEEAGIDGLHAEAADHLECDGEEQDAVAGGRQSARLIFETVADSICVASIGNLSVWLIGRRRWWLTI